MLTVQRTFLKNLEHLLKEQNLSKRELARRVDVAPATMLAWWPPKECEPKLSTLARIAKTMKVSLDWLVMGKKA